MSIMQHFKDRYEATQEEEYTLEEYLEICKKDPAAYATAAERMLLAIGEPEHIDTSRDSRLSRIFSNKVIKRYPEFSEFYGSYVAVLISITFSLKSCNELSAENAFIGDILFGAS